MLQRSFPHPAKPNQDLKKKTEHPRNILDQDGRNTKEHKREDALRDRLHGANMTYAEVSPLPEARRIETTLARVRAMLKIQLADVN